MRPSVFVETRTFNVSETGLRVWYGSNNRSGCDGVIIPARSTKEKSKVEDEEDVSNNLHGALCAQRSRVWFAFCLCLVAIYSQKKHL